MGTKSRLKKERRESGYKRVRPEPGPPLTELIRDCPDLRKAVPNHYARGYDCPLCNGWRQQRTVIGSGVWLPLHEDKYIPPKPSRKDLVALHTAGMLASGLFPYSTR
jgi:hypothetical protein